MGTFDGRWGANAGVRPVLERITAVLRDHELPMQVTIVLVQAKQDATVPLISRIARPLIVGTHEDPAARDDRGGM